MNGPMINGYSLSYYPVMRASPIMHPGTGEALAAALRGWGGVLRPGIKLRNSRLAGYG
jgi:hypothetical protein